MTARSHHPPTGQGLGAGRVVYLFWGHGGDPEAESAARAEDVAALTEAGYAVVVDRAPGRRALCEALYGQDPELEGQETVAVCWSGEAGRDGSLRLAGGEWVSPQAIEPAFVTHELEWVAFSRARGGDHAAAWQARLGEHVTVRAEGEPRELAGALVRAALLPGGAGARSVPPGDGPWSNGSADGPADGPEANGPGEDPGQQERARTFASDPEQDAYWRELFGLLEPERARAIEEGLGLSTRHYVWSVGELLAQAAIAQLQGKSEQAAEQHASASGAASLLTRALPPLFASKGDPAAAVAYLREVVPKSSLGRGAERLGPDHSALLRIALQLPLLALDPETSDPVRAELERLGPASGLPEDLRTRVLGYRGADLFTKAHEEVAAALAGEGQPRHTTRALAFGLGRRLAIAARMSPDDPDRAEWLVSCQDMADLLKATLPDPLPRQGRFPELAGQVGARHGPDHEGLFVLATQLMDLRSSYDPMSPETAYRLTQRLDRAREEVGLPAALFAPLARIKQCTASRGQGYDLVDQVLHAISEHLLAELD